MPPTVTVEHLDPELPALHVPEELAGLARLLLFRLFAPSPIDLGLEGDLVVVKLARRDLEDMLAAIVRLDDEDEPIDDLSRAVFDDERWQAELALESIWRTADEVQVDWQGRLEFPLIDLERVTDRLRDGVTPYVMWCERADEQMMSSQADEYEARAEFDAARTGGADGGPWDRGRLHALDPITLEVTVLDSFG
jgi:hypothetical protein